MAMVPTGPWQLPEITEHKVDYGVVQMPSFNGKPVTISGPDTWMVLDNGDAPEGGGDRVRQVARPARAGRGLGPAGGQPAAAQGDAPAAAVAVGAERHAGDEGVRGRAGQRARAAGARGVSEGQPGHGAVDRLRAARQGVAAGRAQERGRRREHRPLDLGARSGGSRWPPPTPPRRFAPPRASLRERVFGETPSAWLFIAPAVVVILGLSIVPLAWSLLLSFKSSDLVTPSTLDRHRQLQGARPRPEVPRRRSGTR